MTLFWIIVAVLVVLTWLPVGSVATVIWSDFIRPRNLLDGIPMPYVLGWLYVALILMALVAVAFLLVLGLIVITFESIWAFVKGGAPGYWRNIVEESKR